MNDAELASAVTTPMAATMIKLLGVGSYCKGLKLSISETKNLRKVYDIILPPPDRPPTGEDKWGDGPEYTDEDTKQIGIDRFYEAGAIRNMFRHAEHDGLRVMAVLAKHLEKNEDPVKMIIRLLNDAGYDHPDDFEWASEDDDG